MRKCPELSKLPKALHISSVNFRRQTPGSIGGLWQASTSNTRLDRNHPSDLLPGKKRAVLWAPPCNAFTLGAIPMGLLLNPDDMARRAGYNRSSVLLDSQQRVVGGPDSFDSWNARIARGRGAVAPMLLNEPHHTRHAMSLQMHSSRDVRTHHRVAMLRRFKTAVCLVAIRGAAAKEVGGGKRLKLVFDEKDAERGWILAGWTYYLRPSLELVKMPYPELVGVLRPALADLWTRGTAVEAQWTAASLGGGGTRSSNSNNTSRHRSKTEAPSYASPESRHASSSRPPPGRTHQTASPPTTTESTRSKSNRQNGPFSEYDGVPKNRDHERARAANTDGARAATAKVKHVEADSLRGQRQQKGDTSRAMLLDKRNVFNFDDPSLALLPDAPDFDPFFARVAEQADFGRPQKKPDVSQTLVANASLVPDLGVSDLDVSSLPDAPDFDPFPTLPVRICSTPPSAATASESITSKAKAAAAIASVDDPSARDDFNTFGLFAQIPNIPDDGDSVQLAMPARASTPTAAASAAPLPISNRPSQRPKSTRPDPDEWAAIGRKIEAAIVLGQGEEGPMRWDASRASLQQGKSSGPPALEAKEGDKKKETAQSRLARMLYQRDDVVRPNSEDRKAKRIPWQTHRFEEK
ncbi:hypothetical protein B0H14DRAFT_709975 [Mycena olivaceomarginata]|nr:hypothetical protein B0H14DRAFT_709975 [Mycena olivaceomarginata]